MDSVHIRLNDDLSGRFSTIMAAIPGRSSDCRAAPSQLRDFVQHVIAQDPVLAEGILYSPYDDAQVSGARVSFGFASPEEIGFWIGRIQRLDLGKPEEEWTEENREFQKMLKQIDTLPVDFDSIISPVVKESGKQVWNARFRGDAGSILDLNIGDDSRTHCSGDEITFAVTMPARVVEYSPVEGRVSATRINDHTIEWTIPKTAGPVELTLRAERAIASGSHDETSDRGDWLSSDLLVAILTLAAAVLGVLAAWTGYARARHRRSDDGPGREQ